jgi:tRNA 5-methylaminomethyl-2-thiouridine biosynthesis bifunctional protein
VTSQPPIETETLQRDAEGHPFSARYGDIYANRSGALAQARAVFLEGCGLLQEPRRWAGQRQFVVLESGFGLGTNFLATWQAWRADPRRCATLHYVGIERHPLRAQDLLDACAAPELLEMARELAAAWPLPLRGLHPIHLDGGRVRLTLALGDALALLRQLDLGADAIYLDGFAPSCNPAMWDVALLKAVGRLARPDARLASYTVARAVREGLREAGFEVAKLPGGGGKSERLQARYAPAWRTRRHEPRAPRSAPRQALVLGAGLGGAACARALAARGWEVEVLDAAGAAAGASGLPAGLAHLRVSPDDDRLSRLSRAGLAWLRLALPDPARYWQDGGIFMADAAPRPGGGISWPPEIALAVDAAQAGADAGCAARLGGWRTAGGVAAAAELVRAWLRTPGVELRDGQRVERLRHADGQWQALDAAGALLAQAPVCIVANALDTARLLEASGLGTAPLQPLAGQAFILPAAALPALAGLRRGVLADCYALPLPPQALRGLGLDAASNWLFVGATYEDDPAAPLPAQQVWDHVRAGLEPLCGPLPAVLPAQARLFQGVRAAAPDRLPAAGPWPDWEALARAGSAHRAPHEWPALPGLHLCSALGSRGLVLGALAAECIASALEGEPAPLERELLDALAPGRFRLRELRGAAPRATSV